MTQVRQRCDETVESSPSVHGAGSKGRRAKLSALVVLDVLWNPDTRNGSAASHATECIVWALQRTQL